MHEVWSVLLELEALGRHLSFRELMRLASRGRCCGARAGTRSRKIFAALCCLRSSTAPPSTCAH